MICPIRSLCPKFNSDHLAYLQYLKTPEAVVWG